MTTSFDPVFATAPTEALISLSKTATSAARDLRPELVESRVKEVNDTTNFSSVKAFSMEVMEDCVKIQVAAGTFKTISLTEFKELFLKEIKQDIREESSNILLPPNTTCFSRSNSSMVIETFHPENIAKVVHLKKTYEIPFPNTVIIYELKTEGKSNCWTVSNVSYKAYTGEASQINASKAIRTNLKQMPFPNFYSHGGMCYGGNSMPNRFTGGNLKGLKYYYDVIFLSPFNNDLGIQGTKRSYSPETWFKHLSTLKTFPYSELA